MTENQQHYQVIARRYRPRSFDEVVGQEATAQTLKQAILQQRTAHAYLFCGPRGVGKTSMARIFARSLQCPNAVEAEPCDKCPTCDRIFHGEDDDVQEMDGASHRGIDDVRDLIQHVRYAPAHGDYRIFIIDEVHMLTREAFNALLKTLEEPPAHVLFVFATTEPEKLPPTVLSRCQRCDFSPVSTADIVRRLQQICDAEGASPEAGVLERVADLARGGMRDSQSLLDQLLSFSENKPTQADLDFITGRLSPEEIRALVDEIDGGDRAAVVQRLQGIEQGGTDPSVLLEQIMEELRTRLHEGVAAGWQNAEIERNLLAQEILQEARLRTRQLSRAEVVLELALLRMATLADLVPLEDLLGGGGVPTATPPRAPQTPPQRQGPPPSAAPTRSGGTERSRPPEEAPSSQSSRPQSSRPQSSRSQASRPEPSPSQARSVEATATTSAQPEPAQSAVESAPPRERLEPTSVATQSPEVTPSLLPQDGGNHGGGDHGGGSQGGDTWIDVVRRALEQAAPMLARSVGDGIQVGGDRVTLTLANSSFATGKIGVCERAISDALGRRIKLELDEPTGADDGEEGDAVEDSLPLIDPDAPPPPIVAKAQEIFRGSVQASLAPPPRREQQQDTPKE